MINGPKTKKEIIEKGKKAEYDICSENHITELKGLFKKFKYVGSGDTFFINNQKFKSKKIKHFFKK